MEIQLFVSDLDGTLLNEHSQVASETAQAIQRVQQAGIRWLTATGRSWNTAAPLLQQAGISCDFVLLNGAELRNAKGELLLDASLSTATARQAADILSEHGIGLEINTDQGDFTTDTQFCSAAPLPEDFWSRPLTVRKLFGFCRDAAKLDAARQALGALNGVSITSSAPWNIEITAHEARKARMVERAAQLYSVDLDHIVVFGDGSNDESLFRTFPHSRAMENAVPLLHTLAEKVIESNVDCGVAKEVQRILSDI
ncbi:Cof-type HAD-IIB family hydrolase [Butyricicoccus pullicaecorum]|uniref:Cof-like hydrolase n=1 Tax=Butyricicoccus pullicaecorum 1.2 TaxID=1203606 RepID=R8VTG1_9FIRM|nr:HAD family hydrolase [Butyricicoccus pullicaecorum]EOQ35536.1 cof-like hydrolase [Butyricicoccus pullicaecorum 1.2]SKA66173.1 hypothetical protein SAMN02745978_02799 [Butyricicoccus pullicaecorum DSM 23266]